MSEFKFYPKAVVWEITFACNMRCLHCGTSAGKIRHDELSTKEALGLIDELAALGCEELTLSGGEPLLRPDWRELATHTVEKGIKSYIISNGYALTRDIVKDFKQLRFTNVGVSFDGTEKTHNYIRQRDDSFAKVVRAMEMMTEEGVPYCAVSQISNINLDELDAIRDILVKIGAKQWRIQMTTSTGRMKDHRDLVMSLENYPRFIDKIIELKTDSILRINAGENIGYYGCKGYELLGEDNFYLGCYAGTRVAGICSNGNVKGCLSMQEQFVEGNIRDSSFTEIWNNPDGFAYNRKFTKETATGFCHDCRYLPICRGGCTTTSVSATGDRANNPFCIYQIEKQQGIECKDPLIVTRYLESVKEAEAKINKVRQP